MPELPEVEIICLGLREKILGDIILGAEHITKLKLRQEVPINISKKITNAKIVAIERRAKYIQIFLSNNLVILIHLGMSGKLLIKDSSYILQKHDHFVVKFNDKWLVFNDPRRFGLITLIEENNLKKHPIFAKLGMEPFDAKFTPKYLEGVFKNKQPIKLALMDNYKLVGVGNIYASESLFFSKISPTRASNSLEKKELIALHYNIKKILENSIKLGGSSLKDYAKVSGEKGYFQNFFYVYGREGKDCRNCGAKIIKIKQAGRASFYCADCQK